jgi:putative thiamine transport system permease protein
VLAACVVCGAAIAALAWRAMRPIAMRRFTRGDRRDVTVKLPSLAAPALGVVYLAAFAMLVFVSLAGVWPYPDLWPASWSTDAWLVGLRSAGTLVVTLGLAIASAITGLALAVAWMETTPPHWDLRAAPAVFAPMLVPGVLLSFGLYELALRLRVDGTLAGLWIAHSLHASPYVLVALAPAYRGFDARFQQTSQTLGRGAWTFLRRVKWPMLMAPMASACSVGFAVSVTQYLSTQFVGAGRHATLTTEAITLASGGQRQLAAAFALLQAVAPALAFAAAWWIGKRQALHLQAEQV